MDEELFGHDLQHFQVSMGEVGKGREVAKTACIWALFKSEGIQDLNPKPLDGLRKQRELFFKSSLIDLSTICFERPGGHRGLFFQRLSQLFGKFFHGGDFTGLTLLQAFLSPLAKAFGFIVESLI